MLAHLLAVLLGFSSFVFYIAAFFYPEVHRRSDILWSALGTFYALTLWFSAGQMTGTALLGQVISVALLVGLGWQTLTVRREKTPVYQQTPIVLTPEVVGSWAKNKLNQLRIAPDDTVRPLPPQNRSLSATAADRFRQDIDPRRRPVYDYEFVEDGDLVADGEPIENEIALPSTEPVAVNFQNLAVLEDLNTLEDADIVPPSAAAKILSEQSSETDKIDEIGEAIALPAKATQAKETVETISLEIKEMIPPESNEATETDSIEKGETLTNLSASETEATFVEPQTTRQEELQPEKPQPKEPQPVAAPSDTKVAQSEAPTEKTSFAGGDKVKSDGNAHTQEDRTPVTKPSLLATPVILLGWVKDVIGSITKPKPARPVIDIPRRDPQPPDTRHTRSDTEPSPIPQPIDAAPDNPSERTQKVTAPSTNQPFTPEPLTPEPLTPEPDTHSNDLDNSGNFDDDNDWEDSNWDD